MRRHCLTRFAPFAMLTALLPRVASAQDMMGRLVNAACNYGPFACPDNTAGGGLRRAAGLVGLVLGALLAFLGVVFMLLMIMAGWRWMMARGNEAEVTKAQETIKSAAIGLLVVLLAYALVTFASAIITQSGLIKT
ncbi:MAG: hypothetical protein PHI63_05990 [Patescibacteria group bacterium]|nr:hypothetical protein [Patescibacteria group bacterium]